MRQWCRRAMTGAATALSIVLLLVPGISTVHNRGPEWVAGHTAAGRVRPPVSYEQALAVLTGAHAEEGGDVACPPGTQKDRTGGIYGNRTECVIVEDPLFHSHWRLTYEPATPDGKKGSDVRSRYDDGKPTGHVHHGGACQPTAAQRRFADWLVSRTRKDLMDRYLNNPWQVLADGFVAYPIPDTKWFHIFNPKRTNDGPYLAPDADGNPNPASRVFNPDYVESFMYGMTDQGLTPLGAMFELPQEYKDWPSDKLPNPTGCLLQWHNHTGAEGAASSFDPSHPSQSVWMAHVWTYGDIDPWGNGFDGSEPEQWFVGYRYVPAFCNDTGGCV